VIDWSIDRMGKPSEFRVGGSNLLPRQPLLPEVTQRYCKSRPATRVAARS
jgi:hypothetical protein